MMRRLLLLSVLLMCGAVYAFAGPEEFTFLAWNNGQWQNGYPYEIQETDNPSGSVIAAMCDDYLHGGVPGDMWFANITNLGSQNISLARFNDVLGPFALYPLMLYEESGWLLLQTQVEPTNQWLSLNSAVWNIFDPSAPCDSTCQVWRTAAQNEAKIGFPGVDFNRVYIVTPVNQHDPDPNGVQEFLYIGEDPSGGGGGGLTTPEPGTLLLMGTGLLAAFGRKFWR
jgi:PEP-CTERM motif-containing protein